jgi:tRNA threonylcarbamoyladenosine biosynthesis protein TsaB
MTIILALDTSTEACSCALQVGGEIIEDYAVIPRQHAQNILPMIQRLLHDAGLGFAQLDAIAFGRGPGSFTGLRIAAGVAQGLALASDLPVLPISTLAALALQAHAVTGDSALLACLDARIDEVYWAWYSIENCLPVLQGDEVLCKPELMYPCPAEFTGSTRSLTAVGNGLEYIDRFPLSVSQLAGTQLPEQLPRAASMVRLALAEFLQGRSIKPEEASPIYLRDKVTRN